MNEPENNQNTAATRGAPRSLVSTGRRAESADRIIIRTDDESAYNLPQHTSDFKGGYPHPNRDFAKI